MTTKTYDGQTARFLASVATCMPSLTSDVMQGWIDNPRGLRKVLCGLNPPAESLVLIDDVFRLTVDYGQSLEQMIAAGRYDWKNSDITKERFPIEGKGLAEFEARYFDFDISSEGAVDAIKQEDENNPWSPAKIEHVCSLGSTFPDEQRKFPIIGLGSVAEVNDYRSVPCLYRGASERYLYLCWWHDDCYPVCRFLAVRKVSVA